MRGHGTAAAKVAEAKVEAKSEEAGSKS